MVNRNQARLQELLQASLAGRIVNARTVYNLAACIERERVAFEGGQSYGPDL